MDRRDFIKTTAAIGAASLLPQVAEANPEIGPFGSHNIKYILIDNVFLPVIKFEYYKNPIDYKIDEKWASNILDINNKTLSTSGNVWKTSNCKARFMDVHIPKENAVGITRLPLTSDSYVLWGELTLSQLQWFSDGEIKNSFSLMNALSAAFNGNLHITTLEELGVEPPIQWITP